jgi:transglutaminase-like putative cysteine protease
MTSLSHIPRLCFFWLLMAQLALVGAHATELPWWIWPLWGICYGWRLMIYYGRLGFPKNYVIALLVVAGLVGLAYYYDDLIDLSLMNAVLILAFLLKLLELKQRRDVYVVIFLGYFLVGSHFLFYQDFPHAILATVCIVLLLSSQIALHSSHAVSRWKPLRLAVQMMLQAVPVMVILFMIFPRIGPIWSIKLSDKQASVGLSDTISPGDVSQLARRSELAFRASFDGATPPAPQDLYWRTLVLSDFDGRVWSPIKQHVPPGSNRVVWLRPKWPQPEVGRKIRYHVIAEPSRKRWLFALPWAFSTTSGVDHLPERRLQAKRPLDQRFQYHVISYLDMPDTALNQTARDRHLALPAHANPRSREFARQRRAAAPSDRDYIQDTLTFYREQPFVYTLNPPELGLHTIDEFLFQTRRGFCEHYASSFVFLMRAAGIPARIVAGYQGGKVNPFENYLLVYQYDAHAWAEVWLPEQGWQRVDPTAAVAPHRIELGSEGALAAEDGFLADSPFSRVQLQLGWLRNLQLRVDQLNFLWYRWVLSYDNSRQQQLYRDWLGKLPEWQCIALILSLLALPVAALALGMYWRGRPVPPSAADRLWVRLSGHFAHVNLARRHGEGPTHYIKRLQAAYPSLNQELDAFLEAYIAINYREYTPRHMYLSQMTSLLQQIKSKKAPY